MDPRSWRCPPDGGLQGRIQLGLPPVQHAGTLLPFRGTKIFDLAILLCEFCFNNIDGSPDLWCAPSKMGYQRFDLHRFDRCAVHCEYFVLAMLTFMADDPCHNDSIAFTLYTSENFLRSSI